MSWANARAMPEVVHALVLVEARSSIAITAFFSVGATSRLVDQDAVLVSGQAGDLLTALRRQHRVLGRLIHRAWFSSEGRSLATAIIIPNTVETRASVERPARISASRIFFSFGRPRALGGGTARPPGPGPFAPEGPRPLPASAAWRPLPAG